MPFLTTNWLIIAVLVAGVGLIAADKLRVKRILNEGRAIERQKTETANANVTKTGNAAAGKSRTAVPADSGVRILPELSD